MASAQAPAIQWDKTISGGLSDDFYDLAQTSDGGYILGGRSMSVISGDKSESPFGSYDYWVIKLDASGSKIWDRTLGGDHNDYFSSVIQTSDGGYLIGGDSHSDIYGNKTQASRGFSDYWIVKLDGNGTKLWDKTFGGTNYDFLTCFVQTSDGGYALGGYSASNISADKTQDSNGSYDFWILKLDSNGNKLWDKTYGGNLNDEMGSLTLTSDGGYLLGGSSDSDISGSKTQGKQGIDDYWVVKLDANGNKIWDKTFGGNAVDRLNCLQQTTDSGYILGGISKSGISGNKSHPSWGNNDYWVIKLDANGNKSWDKTFGGLANDELRSLTQTLDGNFILGGFSNSQISGDKSQASFGSTDYWILKMDSNGNKLWDKTIGGSFYEEMHSIAQTSDGGYVLGGYSNSEISANKTQVCKGSFDYWIVKLGPDLSTGINEPTTNLNLSISPNPSQGKFQLQLNNLTAKTAEVTVSDLVGRTVYQQQFPVTENQVTQQINLPHVEGMYLLQVKAGAQTTTRKLVIE